MSMKFIEDDNTLIATIDSNGNMIGLLIPAPLWTDFSYLGCKSNTDSVATVITFQEYTDGSNGGRTINKDWLVCKQQ